MNWIKDLKQFDKQYFQLNPGMKLSVDEQHEHVRSLRMELIREEYLFLPLESHNQQITINLLN